MVSGGGEGRDGEEGTARNAQLKKGTRRDKGGGSKEKGRDKIRWR